MIDSNYFCENQMYIDECLEEMNRYKWETGQYMNLPEMEDSEYDEYNRLHPKRKRKCNISEKPLHENRVKRSRGKKSD